MTSGLLGLAWRRLDLIFDWQSSAPSDRFAVDLLLGVVSVPEPSTGLLVALGFCALACHRRRPARRAD